MDVDNIGYGSDAIEIEGAPAYDISAWNSSGSGGPQCSMSGNFCFLCVFRDESDDITDGEEDDCGALKTMIRALAREKKEIPIIVNSVYTLYEKHIRPQCEYTHPITGVLVKKPKWNKTSIQTHLIYSREFPDLFDSIVEQVFHTVINSQQQRVMNKNTGAVLEDKRRSLMDSINNCSRWRIMQNKLYSSHGSKPPPPPS